MLAQILAFCARIYGAVIGTNTLLNIINGSTQNVAQETTPNHIENMLLSEYLYTHVGVYSFPSIRDQLVDIVSRLTILQASVDAVPANPQLDDQPVILPTSPPTGYGTDNTGAANAVWSYVLGQGEDAGSALDDLYGSRASLFSNTFATLPGFPWMVAYSLNGWQNYGESNIHPPAHLDALTILPSDASILAWANRAHPGTGGWTNTSFRGTTVPMQLDDNRSDVKWVITMTPAEFAAFQAVPVVVRTPPVWPGLAGKTWGTPVALADQLTITAAMDGIAIAIDSTPARLSFWQFDDLRSYRNLGAISFFTDNGDQEAAQTMGFDEAIYTPKTMVRAGGVKIRLTGGVTGTIYPWTITP